MKRPTFRLSAVALLASLILAPATSPAQPPDPAPPGAAAGAAQPAGGEIKVPILEGYPNRVLARIEQRRRTLSQVRPPSTVLSPGFVFRLTKRWTPGQTIKIAFRGGDPALHEKIADTVSDWMKCANLKFDFGRNPITGHYRSWKPTDASYAADIRVSFDQPGYFSLVGTDSINPQIARPGEESLNLEGFDRALPSDWRAVSLHEFGHAIGFEHEHQGPDAMCDFRFDDDRGYIPTTDSFGQFIPDPSGKRPGLYTLLGGPPNNWPQAVVDFNLKQMPKSSAIVEGPFDKESIMKYFFEDFMFVSGKNSACYTDSENLVLSAQDKAGASKVYPFAAAAIAADVDLRSKVLKAIEDTRTVPSAMKEHLRSTLAPLRSNDR